MTKQSLIHILKSNMISHSLLRRSAAAVAMASLILPSIASAQVVAVDINMDATTNVKARGEAGIRAKVDTAFCANIGTHLSNIEVRLGELRAKVDTRRDERTSDLEKRRSERERATAEARAKGDGRRSELSAKLEAKADTDAEKAAIVKFQADVRAAVEARVAAYKAANDAFRKGVDSAVASRKASVEAAVTTFRASIKTALEKAKADCAAGVAAATVRANFNAALTRARAKFEQDRQAIDKIGAQVRVLAESRKRAHVTAMTTFQAAMDRARAALKAAFEAETST
jgi:hypothetical protein